MQLEISTNVVTRVLIHCDSATLLLVLLHSTPHNNTNTAVND